MSAVRPMPVGLPVRLDPNTRRLDAQWVFGGSPARVLRLSAAGQTAYREMEHGTITSRAGAVLARVLSDGGLAHPVPSPDRRPFDVTVVVPARDRLGWLNECLAALGRAYPVVVVDDGSHDPAGLAAVAAGSGAHVIRRPISGGPAAARNTALASVTTEFVAFVDSDCRPGADWIARLAGQFADPLVVAVAPRVRGAGERSSAERYARAAGSLDLGDRPARVQPGTRVAYVPTAALIVRRDALQAVAGDGPVFDETLRYGEDVDLVWRLHEAGGRIRYDPSVVVGHHEPDRWSAYLVRRFRYGTSAAPLAGRHPGSVAPLVLYPWPTLVVAAALTHRPGWVLAGLAGSALATARSLRRAGIPTRGVAAATLRSTRQTAAGIARYATQFAGPLLVATAVAGRGDSTLRRRTRRAAAALLAGPPIAAWCTRRPAMNPVVFALAAVADDVAYGSGVWWGAWRARDLSAVRPAWRWRALPADVVPSAAPAAST